MMPDLTVVLLLPVCCMLVLLFAACSRVSRVQ
jgi:hypothetical protein